MSVPSKSVLLIQDLHNGSALVEFLVPAAGRREEKLFSKPNGPSSHTEKLRDLRLDSREVTRLVSIKVTQQSSERKVIPGDEGDVGNGTLAAHEPFLFGEHRLKDGKDTNDLLLVSLDRTRDLLTVEHLEPGCLTEVRTVR